MTRGDAAAAAVIAAVALLCVTVPYLITTDPRTALCLSPSAPAPHDGMVWIPPGAYAQGDTVYPEEGPVAPVRVKGFWMDRHEVTNAQFAAFVAATGYVTQAERQREAAVFVMPKTIDGTEDISQWWRLVGGANWRHPAGPDSTILGKENYPVIEVTEADALAYAHWKGRALPTEAEWEWAARAGDPQASHDHDQPIQANTWQGIFPVLNSGEDGFVGLAPIGCYGANAYGLYDMLGNVWELTSDPYAPRHGDDPAGAITLRGGVRRTVIKGGSFLCAPNYCMRYRSGAREGQEADLGASHLGFRTVLRSSLPSP